MTCDNYLIKIIFKISKLNFAIEISGLTEPAKHRSLGKWINIEIRFSTWKNRLYSF